MEDRDPFEVAELRRIDDELEVEWLRSIHGKGVRKLRRWQKVLLVVFGPIIEMLKWLFVAAVLVESIYICVKKRRRDGKR